MQTEIIRKKLIIHLNRFDYSQLHFCVRNFLSEIAQVWSVYLYWHQTRPELTLPKGGRVKDILSFFGFRPLVFSSSCEFLPSENRLCHFKTNAWVTSLCYGVVCIILNVSVWLLNILGQLYGRTKTEKKGFQDLINRFILYSAFKGVCVCVCYMFICYSAFEGVCCIGLYCIQPLKVCVCVCYMFICYSAYKGVC